MADNLIFGLSLNEAQAIRTIDRTSKIANAKFNNIDLGFKNTGRQPLGKISADLDDFDKSLSASTARVVAFGATTGILFGFQSALRGIVSATIDVEKSLADINVILNASQSQLSSFGSSLFELASQTGQSFDVAAEAANEFARQGLSLSQTLKATEAALVLTRISGLSAADSVQTLTAAVNTFATEGLSAERVTNLFANLDAGFAVSTKDLAEGFRRVGSTAQDAGVSSDELGAILTSLQQTTARGGAVIGNGLKTIFTRIQRSDVQERLEGIGVATRNSNGEFRNAIDVLKDTAAAYRELDDASRSEISEALGGVFQINTVKAIFSDLGKEAGSSFSQALATATRTGNEAFERNILLNQTLAARVQETKNSFLELGSAIGGLAISDNFKGILDELNPIINGLSDLLDKDIAFSGRRSNPLEDELLAAGLDVSDIQLSGLEQLGRRVAVSFVEGLGDAITGPGLAILGKVLFSLSGRVARDTFSGLGNVLSNNSEILKSQQQITQATQNAGSATERRNKSLTEQNSILKRNTAEIQRQISLLSSAGVAPIANGPLTGGRTGPRRRRAVRNFTDGLMPAIAREQAGIRVGAGGASPTAKPKIATIRNERGFTEQVVVNSDEKIVRNFAGTGQDAILTKNMQKSLGGVNGLSQFGEVRNFVDGNIDLSQISTSDLRQRVTEGRIAVSQVDDVLNRLAVSLGRNSKEFKNAQRELADFSAVDQVRRGKNRLDNLTDRQLEIAVNDTGITRNVRVGARNRLANRGQVVSLPEDVVKEQERLIREQRELARQEGRLQRERNRQLKRNAREGKIISSRQSSFGGASVAPELPLTKSREDLQRDIEVREIQRRNEASRERRLAEVTRRRQERLRVRDANLEPSGFAGAIRRFDRADISVPIPTAQIPTVPARNNQTPNPQTQNPAQLPLPTTPITRRVEVSNPPTQRIGIIDRLRDFSRRVDNFNPAQAVSNLDRRLERATGGAGNTGLIGGFLQRRRQRIQSRRDFNNTPEQRDRRQRFQNRALALSFIAPIAAQTFRGLVGDNSQEGRFAADSVSNIATGASLGAFAGPKGLAVGAGIGALVSLDGLFELNSISEDQAKELDRESQEFTKLQNSLTSYQTALGELLRLRADENASFDDVRKAEERLRRSQNFVNSQSSGLGNRLSAIVNDDSLTEEQRNARIASEVSDSVTDKGTQVALQQSIATLAKETDGLTDSILGDRIFGSGEFTSEDPSNFTNALTSIFSQLDERQLRQLELAGVGTGNVSIAEILNRLSSVTDNTQDADALARISREIARSGGDAITKDLEDVVNANFNNVIAVLNERPSARVQEIQRKEQQRQTREATALAKRVDSLILETQKLSSIRQFTLNNERANFNQGINNFNRLNPNASEEVRNALTVERLLKDIDINSRKNAIELRDSVVKQIVEFRSQLSSENALGREGFEEALNNLQGSESVDQLLLQTGNLIDQIRSSDAKSEQELRKLSDNLRISVNTIALSSAAQTAQLERTLSVFAVDSTIARRNRTQTVTDTLTNRPLEDIVESFNRFRDAVRDREIAESPTGRRNFNERLRNADSREERSEILREEIDRRGRAGRSQTEINDLFRDLGLNPSSASIDREAEGRASLLRSTSAVLSDEVLSGLSSRIRSVNNGTFDRTASAADRIQERLQRSGFSQSGIDRAVRELQLLLRGVSNVRGSDPVVAEITSSLQPLQSLRDSLRGISTFLPEEVGNSLKEAIRDNPEEANTLREIFNQAQAGNFRGQGGAIINQEGDSAVAREFRQDIARRLDNGSILTGEDGLVARQRDLINAQRGGEDKELINELKNLSLVTKQNADVTGLLAKQNALISSGRLSRDINQGLQNEVTSSNILNEDLNNLIRGLVSAQRSREDFNRSRRELETFNQPAGERGRTFLRVTRDDGRETIVRANGSVRGDQGESDFGLSGFDLDLLLNRSATQGDGSIGFVNLDSESRDLINRALSAAFDSEDGRFSVAGLSGTDPENATSRFRNISIQSLSDSEVRNLLQGTSLKRQGVDFATNNEARRVFATNQLASAASNRELSEQTREQASSLLSQLNEAARLNQTGDPSDRLQAQSLIGQVSRTAALDKNLSKALSQQVITELTRLVAVDGFGSVNASDFRGRGFLDTRVGVADNTSISTQGLINDGRNARQTFGERRDLIVENNNQLKALTDQMRDLQTRLNSGNLSQDQITELINELKQLREAQQNSSQNRENIQRGNNEGTNVEPQASTSDVNVNVSIEANSLGPEVATRLASSEELRQLVQRLTSEGVVQVLNGDLKLQGVNNQNLS